MRILIVDDERQLVEAVSVILKQNNFSVDAAFDGEEGYDYAVSGVYDLIILDIMMPKIDGISLMKLLRAQNIDTPVLMLSAKADTSDKIEGLNAGADDYLSKPFDSKELLARIKALLRRKDAFVGNVISYGDISLDRDTYDLIYCDKKIPLGKKEFQVLELLILSGGKTINKERVIEKIWGYDSEAEYNTIEVYISFIRKKISALGCKTEIKSIRGVGYKLEKADD